MACGPAAPVSAIAAATRSRSSSSPSWAGRYSPMTSPSARSRSARSGRPPESNASAASRRFLPSRVRTVTISASSSSRAVLPATSSVFTAVRTIRRVADRSSSRDFIAVVRSDWSRSLSSLMPPSCQDGGVRRRAALPLSTLGGTIALGAGCVTWAAAYEVRAFRLRRFEVPVLAPGQRPLRVLQVSDLHLVPTQRRKIEWVRALAGLEPDLVIDTGDNLGHLDAVPAVLEALGPLLERPGAFVMGSNDYFAPIFKNPLRYLAPIGEVRLGKDRLPTEDLRDGLLGAGWVDLDNARARL